MTAFITRDLKGEIELLLVHHPSAGVQIPAGTVEIGETAEKALVREIKEETGLENLVIKNYLGHVDSSYPDNLFIVVRPTKIHARPDPESFSWAELKQQVLVRTHRALDGFTQITYSEENKYSDPEYITFSVTGWIPSELLCKKKRRHFFHVVASEGTPDEWEVGAEPAMNIVFKLFWAPLNALPEIVEPQKRWLDYVRYDLGYCFEREM